MSPMVDPDITDLQKKAEHFESQYNTIKKEFKDFIETTRKNEELKKKDLQADQAKKLLVIADSLCRMMNSSINPSCDAVREVHENYHLNIEGMYQQVLSSGKLTPIDPQPGTIFDDTLHMAVGLEYNNKYPEDTIFSVVRRGYLRESQLIRPAEVIISKKPREPLPLQKPGMVTSIFNRIFPNRQKFDAIAHDIDQLAHRESEHVTRLEKEIAELEKKIEQNEEEIHDLSQIITEQADIQGQLEDDIQKMKDDLCTLTTYVREFERCISIRLHNNSLNLVEQMPRYQDPYQPGE
ncbi:nucleotide exchange factor GrpE [Methanospirillum hungatei]|jgi:molecular chaperone GrpE|uniref:nucleotide exchange factor GrpE n=1 Tax=Methanospirillum hungatei TaxID=2203 RepID=UPI002C6FFE5F|nr:nucleotide exchange factor GrpE [Methanospirillum hungatei]HOW05373.1 nucleotide exchange factor GrpE [Methanospirillum hungatei]